MAGLKPDKHSQSIGFLSTALLETIERETICLPLIVSGLGVSESDETRIQQVKKMISRGIDSSQFVVSFLESVQDVSQSTAELEELVSKMLPGHQFFKVEKNLWGYRERIQSLRNYVVHGRKILPPSESEYVFAFSQAWRKVVFNEILEEFGLCIHPNWILSDIEGWTPDFQKTKAKPAGPDDSDF